MFAFCLGMIVAQAVPPQRAGEEIVGSGCVGECSASVGGESPIIKYKVDADRSVTMVLRTSGTGLCKNTGVFAFLFKNGKEVANGDITSLGDSIETKASPGDNIVAYCVTYPLFNDIVCVRGGELKFDLIKKTREKTLNCLP
jgi:hypothetical protein